MSLVAQTLSNNSRELKTKKYPFSQDLASEKVNLGIERAGILIELENFERKYLRPVELDQKTAVINRWKKIISQTLAGFFTKNNDIVVVYVEGDRFLILKSIMNAEYWEKTRKMLKKSYKAIFGPLKNAEITNVTVGFSNPYSGVNGAIEAYQESNIALSLGSKLYSTNRSYYYNEFGVLSALLDDNLDKKISLAKDMIKDLSTTALYETLISFFRNNLSITDTASELQIHRNTVLYRLDRIAKQIGLDPREFDDSVQIKLALILSKL